jgi:hypothetical protein
MSREIVLVGNGPSILDKELGSYIDEHEIVVRFNAFVTEGFEKHCGTKADIWVRHPYVRELRSAPKVLIKISAGRPLPPFPWERTGDQLMGDAGQVYIEQVLQVTPGRKWCWSTGIHAMAHFSMLYDCVNFCGFCGHSKKGNFHYYEDTETNVLHNFELERKFIDFLKAIGRVQQL